MLFVISFGDERDTAPIRREVRLGVVAGVISDLLHIISVDSDCVQIEGSSVVTREPDPGTVGGEVRVYGSPCCTAPGFLDTS